MFRKASISVFTVLGYFLLILTVGHDTAYANPVTVPADWPPETWAYVAAFNLLVNFGIALIVFAGIHAMTRKNIKRLFPIVVLVT